MIKPFDLKKQQPPPKGIVCAPVSDTTPDGYAGVKQQFLKTRYTAPLGIVDGRYQKDVNNNYVISANPDAVGDINILSAKYVKTGLPDQSPDDISGGNCYWSRGSDGLVLSWLGPYGFHVSPDFEIIPTGRSPIGIEGYMDVLSTNVTINGSVKDIYVHPRYLDELYCHGKTFTTPSEVLSAAMLQDYVVIICKTSRLVDTVYAGKLQSGGAIGFSIVGTITFTDTANLVNLDRQGVYSFSADSLSIIGLTDAINPNDVNNNFTKKIIVRASLFFDGSGDLQLTTATFQLIEMSFLATETITATDSSADVDITVGALTLTFTQHTFSGNRSLSGAVIDRVICVGFAGIDGNTEVIVKPELVSLSATDDISGKHRIGFDSVNVGDSIRNRLENTTISYLFNADVMMQYTFSETESSNIDVNLNTTEGFFYDRTDSIVTNITSPEVVYADIAAEIVVFNKEIFSGTNSLSVNLTASEILNWSDTYSYINTLEFWSKSLGVYDTPSLYSASDSATHQSNIIIREQIYIANVSTIQFSWRKQQAHNQFNIILCIDEQGKYIGQLKAFFGLLVAPFSVNIFIPLIQGTDDIVAIFMVSGTTKSLTGALDMIDSEVFRI
jgi:hypothetical protein